MTAVYGEVRDNLRQQFMVWRETIEDGKLWYVVRQLMYTLQVMVWRETIKDVSLWCGVRQLMYTPQIMVWRETVEDVSL